MKKRGIILIAAFATLLSACIYTNYDTYYVVPEPDDPPVISMTTNLDTLENPLVVDSLEVSYEIVIENGEIYLVEALLSELPVYKDTVAAGAFWLLAEMWGEVGVDTLRIYVYYSTNTNSLGDIVGVEANVLNMEFPVTYDGVVE